MAEKIALERLSVLPDRIEAEVRVLDPAYRTTSPELIAQVLVQFPTIPFHTCRNEAGPTFSAVMENTSLPHLLEHLVIDIQTRAHAEREDEATDPVFTGTTQWSATMSDVAIVRVSFYDDLIALGAFKQALHFINQEHSLRARP